MIPGGDRYRHTVTLLMGRLTMWRRSQGVRLPAGMDYRSLAVQACNVVVWLVSS
jgi:hypothetical protein